jgi:hypothetical protein
MEDRDVLEHINQLVADEHALLEQAEREPLGDAERNRLHALQVSLDQYWDLLRQRRARREEGRNPDRAKLRDEVVVEKYVQ